MITLPISVKHAASITTGAYSQPDVVNGTATAPEDVTYPVECVVDCPGLSIDNQDGTLLFSRFMTTQNLSVATMLLDDFQISVSFDEGELVGHAFIGPANNDGLPGIMAYFDTRNGVKSLLVGRAPDYVPLEDVEEQTTFTEEELERILIFLNSIVDELVREHSVTFPEVVSHWRSNNGN